MCCLFTWLPAGMWLDTQVEVLCPPSGTLKGDVWHLRLDFFQMSQNDFFVFSMHVLCFFRDSGLCRGSVCGSVCHSAIAPCLSGSMASVRPPLTLTLTLTLMGARTNGQYVGLMGGWTKGPKPGCQSVLSYL